VVGDVVSVRRVTLLTDAALVAQHARWSSISATTLSASDREESNESVAPSDLKRLRRCANSGLMMKKFGWNFPEGEAPADFVQKIEPAGMQRVFRHKYRQGYVIFIAKEAL